jgi:hypothetical protein
MKTNRLILRVRIKRHTQMQRERERESERWGRGIKNSSPPNRLVYAVARTLSSVEIKMSL